MRSSLSELINKGIFANSISSPITSSLSEVVVAKSKIAEQFNTYFKSQSIFNSNMVDLVTRINSPFSSQIRSLQSAFQKTSRLFVNDVIDSEEWDDLEVVEDINTSINNITEKYVDSGINSAQLEKLKTEIIDVLNSKFSILEKSLSKTKLKTVYQFISGLIAVVGFYFAYISYNNPAITKVEFVKELQNIKEEFNNSVNIQVQNYFQERVALGNVNLRELNKKNSKKIGLVKKGQEITIIEIKHKWLLIQYFDMETGEPKAGYVFKKYFK